MRYTPPSVRQIGLRNHLGDEKYTMLAERLELGVPIAKIARDLKLSRKWTSELRDIYREEQGLTK